MEVNFLLKNKYKIYHQKQQKLSILDTQKAIPCAAKLNHNPKAFNQHNLSTG